MGAMYHDILLTKNYVIIVDGSLRSDISRISEGKGVVFFNKTKKLRFGVLQRVNPSLKNLRWIVSTRPGHVYHTISAWENEDQVFHYISFNFSYFHYQVRGKGSSRPLHFFPANFLFFIKSF